MPSSAGRCQDENVKVTFKLLQWRRGQTILREPGALATSLVFLLATFSLKKLPALLRQTSIHLTNIYSSLVTSDLVLGAWDTGVKAVVPALKAVVPALELTAYGTPVDVRQVTFSRNYSKWW